MERAILIDIDNTVVNANVVFDNVRDKSREEQFDYFYNHIHDCTPINWIIKIVKRMEPFYHIVFLTGRSAKCKSETIKQLQDLGFQKFTLAMRYANDDETPDDEMKRKLLKTLTTTCEFQFAIDDRESNCKVFTEEFNIPSLVVYYPKEERY